MNVSDKDNRRKESEMARYRAIIDYEYPEIENRISSNAKFITHQMPEEITVKINGEYVKAEFETRNIGIMVEEENEDDF